MFFLDEVIGAIGAIELAYLRELALEFASRDIDCFVIAKRPEFLFDYQRQQNGGDLQLNVDVLSDADGVVAQAVGIHAAQKASFLLDPEQRIRYACSYEAEYPRNVFAILAVYDAIRVGPLHPAMRGLSPVASVRPC